MIRHLKNLPWSWAQWGILPVLVWVAAENYFAAWVVPREGGYVSESASPDREKIDFVFVGSSRVAAALDPTAFAAEYERVSGRTVRALNLGGGGRDHRLHLFGLRNLFADYPERFGGCTVLLEAPFGLAHHYPLDTAWFAKGQWPSRQVVSQIRTEDLADIWRAHPSWIQRAKFAGLAIQRSVQTLYFRRLIGRSLRWKVDEVAEAVAARVGLRHRSQVPDLDLYARGGIRTDRDAVDDAVVAARTLVRQDAETQVSFGTWHGTALEGLKDLVRENGGGLILFETQMASELEKLYTSSTRQEDARTLEREITAWGVPILRIPFRYADEDFPDLWHLRRSLADGFSRRLARQVAAREGHIPSGDAPVDRRGVTARLWSISP